MYHLGPELPQNHREQPIVNGGIGRDATPTAKRPFDSTSIESDPSFAKRVRLTQTDEQRLEIAEETKQATKVRRAYLM